MCVEPAAPVRLLPPGLFKPPEGMPAMPAPMRDLPLPAGGVLPAEGSKRARLAPLAAVAGWGLAKGCCERMGCHAGGDAAAGAGTCNPAAEEGAASGAGGCCWKREGPALAGKGASEELRRLAGRR